jgi:hypothetical protein
VVGSLAGAYAPPSSRQCHRSASVSWIASGRELGWGLRPSIIPPVSSQRLHLMDRKWSGAWLGLTPLHHPASVIAAPPSHGSLGMRFISFLNPACVTSEQGRCEECTNCLNAKPLKGVCRLSAGNAATPAKQREVDLLQWGLDPVAEHRSPAEREEHRSPAEREDFVEPQSIRGGSATRVRNHAKPDAKTGA